MILNTYLNQYGLLIFESNKSYLVMFNGLYLKLNKRKVNLNEIDSIKFYEIVYKNDFKKVGKSCKVVNHKKEVS